MEIFKNIVKKILLTKNFFSLLKVLKNYFLPPIISFQTANDALAIYCCDNVKKQDIFHWTIKETTHPHGENYFQLPLKQQIISCLRPEIFA